MTVSISAVLLDFRERPFFPHKEGILLKIKAGKTGLFIASAMIISACASSQDQQYGVQGNENGSKPINKREEVSYKRAILKCYKTGGSRIVKIEGRLNCY